MSEPASVRRVAVIGAGTIGASWAAYFLSRGLHVTAWDPRPDAEAFVRRFIADAWPALSRLGLASGADPERVRFAKDPAAASPREPRSTVRLVKSVILVFLPDHAAPRAGRNDYPLTVEYKAAARHPSNAAHRAIDPRKLGGEIAGQRFHA